MDAVPGRTSISGVRREEGGMKFSVKELNAIYKKALQEITGMDDGPEKRALTQLAGAAGKLANIRRQKNA